VGQHHTNNKKRAYKANKQMKYKNAKFQMLKSGDHLHIPKLFRTFALSNKGELPFDWFG
jgi:hypothetical protein